MKKIIYPYIRFSSAEQRNGDSIRRQMSSIGKYAERNAFDINEEHKLIDIAVSGYTGKNREEDAGLGRFLLAIEAGLIPTDGSSYLCIEQLDRLSREEIDISFNFFSTILRKNVNIITLMDDKIYTKNSLKSITDIIYSLSIMQQSHIESEKKSIRIKASFEGRLEKIKCGIKAKYASQLPNWIDEYPAKSGIFSVNKNGKIIQRIFTMVLDGTSLNGIARILNNEEIPRITKATFIKGNGLWTGATISHIIKNKCVFGLLELKKIVPVKINEKNGENGENGETIERIINKKIVHDSVSNYYPSLISEPEFVVANSRVKERTITRERGRNTSNNLFSSLVYCGYCKQRMHFELSKKKLKNGLKIYKNLKCSSRRFKDKNCPSMSVNYENFEKAFPLQIYATNQLDEMVNKEKKTTLENALVLKESEYVTKFNKAKEIEEEAMKQNINISIYIGLLNTAKTAVDICREELERIRLDLHFASISTPLKPLLTKEDRLSTKKTLRSMIAGIVIYSNKKTAWFIDKNGMTTGIMYEQDGERSATQSDFRDFRNDILKATESGKIDPQLVKLSHAMTAN
ncbi:MAG: recombinase family protein [Oceanospirillaceae bacterium]